MKKLEVVRAFQVEWAPYKGRGERDHGEIVGDLLNLVWRRERQVHNRS